MDLRARGEPVRWLLKVLNQPYTEERIDVFTQWAMRKNGECMLGALVLICITGIVVGHLCMDMRDKEQRMKEMYIYYSSPTLVLTLTSLILKSVSSLVRRLRFQGGSSAGGGRGAASPDHGDLSLPWSAAPPRLTGPLDSNTPGGNHGGDTRHLLLRCHRFCSQV